MTDLVSAGTYALGDLSVRRMGYGAMQLAGPGVMGPPRDRSAAVAVLRAAIEAGVNHIDTSDFYGPHVTNQIIREALAPYPDDVVIVTKVGAARDEEGAWLPAQSPSQLRAAIEDNLRNLDLERLDVVNLRLMGDVHAPTEGPLEEPFEALAEMQRDGLIRHLGLSNATPAQVAEAEKIAPVVCVQNQYSLVHRHDDAMIDDLAGRGIAFVPFFPLGGFDPIQSNALDDLARQKQVTPMQLALAWLLARSANLLLIPGTSSISHLAENLAAVDVALTAKDLTRLEAIRRHTE